MQAVEDDDEDWLRATNGRDVLLSRRGRVRPN